MCTASSIGVHKPMLHILKTSQGKRTKHTASNWRGQTHALCTLISQGPSVAKRTVPNMCTKKPMLHVLIITLREKNAASISVQDMLTPHYQIIPTKLLDYQPKIQKW